MAAGHEEAKDTVEMVDNMAQGAARRMTVLVDSRRACVQVRSKIARQLRQAA
jgi:hypothetical protein